MNKYIILIESISGMGGGQQYCRNKSLELRRLGYNVKVVSSNDGEISILELKQYKQQLIPEIKFPPYCFSKKQIDRVLKKIISITGELNSDDIIDSSQVNTALWGELLAEKYKCINFCFLIGETFNIGNEDRRFLEYKCLKKQLACTTSTNLFSQIFRDSFHCPEENKLVFSAICRNTIDDIECDFISTLPSCRKCILVFGRLNKLYVKNAARDLANYLHNKHDKFNVIFIGGSSNQHDYKTIYQAFSCVENVNIVITGSIYPVPRILFEKADVVLASAGCAKAAVRESNSVIYYNVTKGKPVGVLNYTLDLKCDHRFSNNEVAIEPLLEDILYNGYISKNKPLMTLPKNDYNEVIVKNVHTQLQYIYDSKVHHMDYYGVYDMKADKPLYIIYKYMIRILGFSTFKLFYSFARGYNN